MNRPSRSGFRPAFALALAIAAVSAAHAFETWNQETVTSLASQLEQATKDLKSTLRSDSNIRDGYRQGDPVISRFAEAIDGIDRGARQLSLRLADGEGYEQTLPVAKKIRSLVRDAEVQGGKIMVTSWMEERSRPVEALLEQLRPYDFDD